MNAAERLLAHPAFRAAAHDYHWLRERGYPEKPSLKLVGDRHRLQATARNALYRSIVPTALAAARLRRLVHADYVRGKILVVDAHNISLTVLNYRLGHPVFLCTDGLTRDAGGAKRRVNRWSQFQSALADVAACLADLGCREPRCYFDAPFSGSATHAVELRSAAERHGLEIASSVVDHADQAVIAAARETGVVASSDSDVVDRSAQSIFDLARAVIERRYRAVIPSVASLFTEAEDSQYF